MPAIEVRKFQLTVEEIHHEFGPPPGRVHRRAALAAVIRNPFASRYEPNLQPMMEDLKPLGLEMSNAPRGGARRRSARRRSLWQGLDHRRRRRARARRALACARRLRHARGARRRQGDRAVGDQGRRARHADRRAAPPRNAAYVRSHFDAIEVGVPDGPRAAELVFILAMTTGGRIHERMGGLKASEIKGEDGQR